jgi:hypothetical protein
MKKYIKTSDGFAININEAWIAHVKEEPEIEVTRGFFSSKERIVKTKYSFDFGDNRQHLEITCDTKEEALKEWERVFSLINGESK